MNTVSSLKRPLTVPSDSCELLVCKVCRKDDNILNLKTCGCLLCDSCDGDSRDKCISCDSEVDPKIKVTFTKNLKCKFYERNKCYSFAEYKCRCLPNCFVCCSCLTYIHRKRVRESCVPEMMRPKITANYEPCELCKEFIAEFKMTSGPYAKICFNCSTNRSSICIPYETNSDGDLDWNQLYRDFEQSSKMASDNVKKTEEVLKSCSLDSEQKIKIHKNLIYKLQKCLDEFTEQYDRSIETLKQQLADFKKDADYLRPDGTTKTILDLLKNKELTLHGENGKEQIINFLKYYREKNNYPVTEQIKTLLSSFDSAKLGLSVDSVGVSDDAEIDLIDYEIRWGCPYHGCSFTVADKYKSKLKAHYDSVKKRTPNCKHRRRYDGMTNDGHWWPSQRMPIKILKTKPGSATQDSIKK